MKKKKNIFNLICFALIFIFTGISAFLGTQSFARYVEQYEANQAASIAKPIVTIQNGALRRTSSEGDVYEYDDFTFNSGVGEFYDVKPNDIIDFYFSVNNFNEDNVLNEVRMRITLDIRIYLRRLAADGDIDEYYVAGNEFLVSSDGEDQEDMDGSNFSLFYSTYGVLSDNIADYLNIPLDLTKDLISSYSDLKTVDEQLKADGKTFYDGKTLKYSGSRSTGFSHYVGFDYEPGISFSQRAFCLKVTLPDQNRAGKEYVTGKLYFTIAVNCEQIL